VGVCWFFLAMLLVVVVIVIYGYWVHSLASDESDLDAIEGKSTW
jgi:hypothetical protein